MGKFIFFGQILDNLEFVFYSFVYCIYRWDLSLQDSFPDYIKITLEFFFNTSNELNAEVAKMQERDMSAYIRKAGVCIYEDIKKQLKHFAEKSSLIFLMHL